MSQQHKEKERVTFTPSDPRLLRAASRIIRLYDLEGAGVIAARPESLAQIIAEELNGRNAG